MASKQLVPLNPKEFDIMVGIDPGVKTGFAIWNMHIKRLTHVDCLMIHQAFDRIRELKTKFKVGVRFEDARLRTWFPANSGKEQYQGAGSIKRDCKAWEDFLTDEGIIFQPIAPKNNTTKLDLKTFNTYTKWSASTNEHSRDAAMLVFSL